MQVTHTFDLALAVRGRRRRLKLRQIELAKGAGVGREWLVDFEHGKPTVELGLTIRTLAALGIEIHLRIADPPDWTTPLTDAAVLRQSRLDAIRPKGRPRRARRDIDAPADYDKLAEWRARKGPSVRVEGDAPQEQQDHDRH